MTSESHNGSIRVLNVCETVTGGIATYLGVVHNSTIGSVQHHYVLPYSQSNEIFTGTNISFFNDNTKIISSKFGFRRVWKLFCATLTAVRNEMPDIFFFHSSFSLPVMMLLRMVGVRKQFVYCPHGWAALRFRPGSFKFWLIALIERSIVKYSDVVINISNFEMSYAKSAGYPGNHRLVVNAVSEMELLTEQNSIVDDGTSINLLFVGRFDRQKGLDVLLNAYAQARLHRQDVNLHIVGDSVRGNSDLLYEQANTIDGVTLYGWCSLSDVSSLCRSVDVLIVPSRWEGFGLVVAEALREGTPVIVSDRGALPEHIEDEKTGYIIKLSENNVCKKIISLDKQRLLDMRPDCRASFEERFSSDRLARELTDIFKELLE